MAVLPQSTPMSGEGENTVDDVYWGMTPEEIVECFGGDGVAVGEAESVDLGLDAAEEAAKVEHEARVVEAQGMVQAGLDAAVGPDGRVLPSVVARFVSPEYAWAVCFAMDVDVAGRALARIWEAPQGERWEALPLDVLKESFLQGIKLDQFAALIRAPVHGLQGLLEAPAVEDLLEGLSDLAADLAANRAAQLIALGYRQEASFGTWCKAAAEQQRWEAAKLRPGRYGNVRTEAEKQFPTMKVMPLSQDAGYTVPESYREYATDYAARLREGGLTDGQKLEDTLPRNKQGLVDLAKAFSSR